MESDLKMAVGYYELGLFEECASIIDSLDESEKQSLEALELVARLAIADKKWMFTLEIARKVVALYPNSLIGYLQKSFALHELGQTLEAFQTLEEVSDKTMVRFEPIYHYNKACYAVVIGDIQGGKTSLAEALRLEPQLQTEAIQDPDLIAIRHLLALRSYL